MGVNIQTQPRARRVAKLAMIFFALSILLDWKSIALWDWKHINHAAGAFDVAVRLAIEVGAAILFALIFDVVFRWLWPKFSRSHSARQEH